MKLKYLSKMKKQEFLAESLPYGFKAEFKEEEVKYCRRKVVGTVGAVYNDGSIVCYDTVNACPDKFKPIIRPISDLTKECIQADYNDGKPFIPIIELAKSIKNSDWEVLKDCCVNEFDDEFYYDETGYFTFDDIELGIKTNINQFQLFQQLLKWHLWPDMPDCEKVIYVTEQFNPYK